MQKILTTIVDEQGFQMHNAPVLVMTEQDAIALEQQSDADMEVHSAVAARFEVLEAQIKQLSEQVKRLLYHNQILRGR